MKDTENSQPFPFFIIIYFSFIMFAISIPIDLFWGKNPVKNFCILPLNLPPA